MKKIEEAHLRKHNMKLYTLYVIFGSDLLFYYGVKILFFSQVKHISDADIVFLSTVFALASLVSLVFANFVNNKTSNRKTLIIGDVINAISMLVLIIGNGFVQMAIAEMLNAVAFALKNISTGPMLEESIPKTDKKSEIFSRIDGKAYFKYCIFSAIATVVAGFLYNVNPYVPMILCLICTVISGIISFNFKEISKEQRNKQKDLIKVVKELKEGFTYTIKSKRIRALLLALGFMWGIFILYMTYQTTLLKNMNISAASIGVIAMFLEIIKGYGGRFANQYNKKLKNKSLTILALTVSISFIIAGMGSLLNIPFVIQIVIILAAFITIDTIRGLYMVLYKKYDNNFSNVKILPTIYTMTNIYWNLERVIITAIGSFVLTIVDVKYGFIVMGVIFIVTTILISTYMKTRVGLKTEEYSKEDLKYFEK